MTHENVKAMNFINSLTPEQQEAIKTIAETIKPALEAIHEQPATTKNYYGDYMRLLSHKPQHSKTLAIAMLYAGANPYGVEAAVKLI